MGCNCTPADVDGCELCRPNEDKVCVVCGWNGEAELKEYASMSRSYHFKNGLRVCSGCLRD